MPWPMTPKAASGPVCGPMKASLMGSPSASAVVASGGQASVGTWKAAAAGARAGALGRRGLGRRAASRRGFGSRGLRRRSLGGCSSVVVAATGRGDEGQER